MRRPFDRRPVKATVFRAASMERFNDARCLHSAGRFRGAIYLCGYALECELKYCVCRFRRIERMEEGEAKRLGHQLTELLDAAGMANLLAVKRDLLEAFHNIQETWSTGIRYSGEAANKKESETFLKDCGTLLSWLRTEQ